MTDRYVYFFMRCPGPAGQSILSKRRATLEAIKGRGEAVMASQIVVDHTEVNESGFLVDGVDNESGPVDEIWAEVRSFERRATSRDSEALGLDESAERDRIYSLRLESRELRSQAKQLRKQRADWMAGECVSRSGAPSFVPSMVTPQMAAPRSSPPRW
jgi:hypothetical protein